MNAWRAGEAAEQWKQEVAPLSGWFSEPLPNPLEEADFALQQVPWLYPSDRKAILEAIDRAGLTICHKAPGDG